MRTTDSAPEGANARPLPCLAGSALAAVLTLALLACCVPARGQTTLLSETFEGAFPGANVWSVSDANPTGNPAYWDDVNTAFGTVGTHGGSWKGYCAGIGYAGTTTNPIYTNSMRSVMSKTLNLAGVTGANLSFWYHLPSIESCCDRFRVLVDGTEVFATGAAVTQWTPVQLSLNAFVGVSRTVTFEFSTDTSINYEGAYLDDITVRTHNAPVATAMVSLENANYSGYVLASDTALGRSNIQAQAIVRAENFTGGALLYTNVLSFRLLNASNGVPHPIYSFGNVVTNSGYTYNLTNVTTIPSGGTSTFTNIAYIRPASWMSQFSSYQVEARLLTNGVVAQTLFTAPATFYHFTNTAPSDVAYNVLLDQTGATWTRTYAINTTPGQNSFQVTANYELRRWDDPGLAAAMANIPLVFSYALRDSAGNAVPLASSAQSFLEPAASYGVIFVFPVPTMISGSRTLDIRPAAQLDSVNRTYYLTVTLAHTNNPVSGQVLTADTVTTSTNRLLHFNGKLWFGNVETTLTALGAPAPPINPPVGGFSPTVLSGAGGNVTASPGHTFTSLGPLNVNLNVGGEAFVTGGSVTLNTVGPDLDVVSRVRFQRGPIGLSPTGAKADVTVTMPPGSGYRTNDMFSEVAFGKIVFSGVQLSPVLEPATDLIYAPGAPLYVTEETKPAWLEVSQIAWVIASGRFDMPAAGPGAHYVRREEYDYLHSVSNQLVNPPEMGDKRSNEKYWLALAGLGGASTIRADTGSNAVFSGTFDFQPGGFRAHFPYDTVVQWGGPGSMRVADDLVTPGASSTLSGAGPVEVPYTRDCVDCGGAGAGLANPSLISDSGALNFTRDGGLVAVGQTLAMVDLEWGAIGPPVSDFAQQAIAFKEAGFHMPGAFVRGDENRLPPHQGPTTILYSGFPASGVGSVERPLTAGYSAGLADYAGLNFRVGTDAAHKGRSTIAGTPGITWDLTGRSKYYVRYAGLSGIHEAVPGTFPDTLTLWGYKFTFQNYGLSYLDSQVKESRTDGAVSVPYPAQFIQNFGDMKFSCLGAPVSADVPAGEGFKVMAYWLADFKTHSVSFKTPTGCTITDGFLVLGIEGYASHVQKALFGEIGFAPTGDQIPRAFGLPGVDSRLRVPNVIPIKGPNGGTYAVTPVGHAYYNTHAAAPPAPTPGWINFFGKLDVPFFEDMQVHLQTSCRTNGPATASAPIYLSGGWPRPGTTNPNHGWTESGHTPFETNYFDWGNRGWPLAAGLTIAKYRDNPDTEQYHPRAQRNWLGFVEFDYPLAWNNTLRTFESWQERTNKLLIVEVRHQVKYLDAKQAELDFGAQYDGLPKISIANLAFNALDEATGVAQAVVEAATQPVHDVLTTGLDEFGQLLDTQMHRLIDGVFDRTVDPVIDQFYGTLSNQWATAWNTLSISERQLFLASVQSNLANIVIGTGPVPIPNNLTAALRDLGSGVSAANNLVGQVENYLRDITNGINAIVGTINMGTNGQALGSNVVGLITKVGPQRPIMPRLLESLVGEVAPQFIDAVVGSALEQVIQEVEPALEQITDTLNQTRAAVMQVQAQLHGAGTFGAELDSTLKSFSAALTNVSLQVSLSVTQYFGQLNYNIDNPFVHLPASEVKRFMRQKVEDYFLASEAAAQVQTVLRQRLYDLDAALREQVDSVFNEFNGIMRDLISQSLAELDNSINKALGDVSEVVGAGKLNGHALITGDSLKLLRIDGQFQFKAPDNIELNAFLQIKEYDSKGTAGACESASGSFTEVTIGANRVPCGWISPDLEANLQAKFTFDGTVPFPVNMGGQLELLGDLSFEAFVLHDLAAALAFGKYENYIALKGGVRFNGYDFSGAVFFGRTCTLDPLTLIDPQVASVLGSPPFTGGYCYAQGWLPVSEMVLGIPASCMFTISAGVGAGAFYFVEGPTYGGKMFLGVSGELLCIVSISGEITMVGVKQGDDLRFSGHGHFEAEVGSCPFCIEVSKDVDITYVDESWHID